MLELNHLYNLDCMEGMKDFPNKYFDLAIVDPPYGNNLNGGCSAKNGWNEKINWNKCNNGWNLNIPDKKYFDELKRISKDQIIWGGNYFTNFLQPSMGWIFWDKGQRDFSLADGELAFTSYDRALRVYNYSRAKLNKDRDGIHPTEKPIALYKWLLKNYAKPDFKIIDTHAGSCSSVIAFTDFGCQWIAFEIDKDYYQSALKRIENHKAQLKLQL